jgi:molybdenum-dependent DNA-binding transcriptional regulator ModE
MSANTQSTAAGSTSLVEILPIDDRQDRWTRSRQAVFLRELAATHCVSSAARELGMGPQSAYRLLARLKS